MKKRHYAWAVLAACSAISLGFGMTMNCNGQYYLPVTSELGFGMGAFTLQQTIGGVLGLASMTMLNKLLDKVPIRLLLSVCLIINLSCLAFMGSFHHLWQWYVFGAIRGIVSPACSLVIPPIILNNWFSKRRGFAIGLAMTFSGIGGAVMNPLLAWIIQNSGWRTAYVANAAITALIVLPFLLFVVRLKPADKGLLPYGEEGPAPAAGETQKNPNPEKSVSRDDALHSASFFCLLFVFAATGFLGGYTQILTAYGVSIGLALAAASIMPSLSMIGNSITKITMGMIDDRFGGRIMISLCLSITMAAMLMLLNGANPAALLFGGAFLSGNFLTLMSVAAPLLVHTIFGSRDYARIFVLLSLSQNFSIATGSSIIGYLYDYTGSYTLSFQAGSILVALTACLTLLAFRFGRRLVWS